MEIELRREQQALSAAHASRDTLECSLKEGLQSAALRHLSLILSYEMRGEKGAALHAMRLGLASDKQAMAVTEMSVQLKRMQQNTGVREMRALIWLILKRKDSNHPSWQATIWLASTWISNQ